MRGSRLLQMLLLLQNRRRMTSGQLAAELQVTRRTILRDVDALTEAGLPIIVSRGNGGGIELGFNYRTRLTGLAADEAEAMAIMLTRPLSELAMLGLAEAGDRCRRKMLESFPEAVRDAIEIARSRYRFESLSIAVPDIRVPAIAESIRERRMVRINARSESPRTIFPVGLVLREEGWFVIDGFATGEAISLTSCGELIVASAGAR